MNQFVSHAYRNGQFFGDMHSAKWIANQPLVRGRILYRLILTDSSRVAEHPSQESFQKRNAPGNHQQPKQKPKDACQNPHALLPRQQTPQTGEASVCGGKRARQTKMCDFNRLRGGIITSISCIGARNSFNSMKTKYLAKLSALNRIPLHTSA